MNWMWDKIQGTSKDNALTKFSLLLKNTMQFDWLADIWIHRCDFLCIITIHSYTHKHWNISLSGHVHNEFMTCNLHYIQCMHILCYWEWAGDREGTSGTDTIIMMAISNLVCWLRNNNKQWTFFAKFKDGNNSTYVSHRNRYTLSTTIEREKKKKETTNVSESKKGVFELSWNGFYCRHYICWHVHNATACLSMRLFVYFCSNFPAWAEMNKLAEIKRNNWKK